MLQLSKQPKKKCHRLLFIGDLTWPPNTLSIVWFCNEVFPFVLKHEANCILDVVGHTEQFVQNKLKFTTNCVFHGYEKSITKYLKHADVFILPFTCGGGVRIKALTAMKNKLPIVSTSTGIQGLDFNVKDAVLVADDPNTFTSQIIRILNNSKLSKRLTRNGTAFMKKYHSSKNNELFLNHILNLKTLK